MGFDEVWEDVRNIANRTGQFCWDGEGHFTAAVHDRFREIPQPSFGVYVVRVKRGRGGRRGQVLYVGKAGAVANAGGFRGTQGLEMRLCNTRHGDSNANQWAQELQLEQQPNGLLIEYAVLQDPRVMSPALAEARLLQAYLEQHGRLPAENRQL